MGIVEELLKQEIRARIMRKVLFLLIPGLLMALASSAQENVSRLSIGGYGEVALSRNFYSDNVYRYSHPDNYKSDKSHGRFDIPHAVIYLGYDFGKGWTMRSEIEFEHTGTGSAVEKEYTEAGEWETEIEKGGEVELEQFWIQKSFARALNVRSCLTATISSRMEPVLLMSSRWPTIMDLRPGCRGGRTLIRSMVKLV